MEYLPWIYIAGLFIAALAGTFWLSRSLNWTRRASRPRSSAENATWQTEIDSHLAEIDSRIRGLSSTLRRLDARESMRSNRQPKNDTPPEATASAKAEWRKRAGILPRPTADVE